MTSAELQHLYDTLGTTRAVAVRLGMSTGTICGHLRRNGVIVRQRGGDWQRMPGGQKGPGKIEINRVKNHAAGDPAFRAKHVTRDLCPHGITCDGAVKPCVMPTDGHCPACLAEHSLASYSGNGASSSWIDPSQGGRGRRALAHQREAR